MPFPRLNFSSARARFGVMRVMVVVLLLLSCFPGRAQVEQISAAFEQANKFYEEGKHAEAAAGYQRLIDSGHASATLYFNLGNAWFKAGQDGRAIAAYRRAETLDPRDPSLRFNLQFVRKKVTGSDNPADPAWQRGLATLTINEWTVLAMTALWASFLLLALREARPSLRKVLKNYTLVTGTAAILLSACLAGALWLQTRNNMAVVVASQAVVRYGPLDESQVYYQLRDGSEVWVLDEKQLDNRQVWVQVRDAAQRIGWVKRDQLVLL